MQKFTLSSRYIFIALIMMLNFSSAVAMNDNLTINRFTILRRSNLHTEGYKYIVLFSCTQTQKSHFTQVNAIKDLIDSETDALFLFPETDRYNELLLSLDCAQAESLRNLINYAAAKGRKAYNISIRPLSVLNHIGIKGALNLSCKANADLILYPFYKIARYAEEIRQKLDKIDNDTEDPALIDGLSLYLKFIDLFKDDIEKSKIALQPLKERAHENFDVFLSGQYPEITESIKACYLFHMYNALICPDLDYLNIFKKVLDHLDLSKIFVFIEEYIPTDYLKCMLLGIGYEEIHAYTNEEVELGFNDMGQILEELKAMFIEGKVEASLWMPEVDRAQASAALICDTLPLVPAEELLSLKASELISDIFTNRFEDQVHSQRTYHISELTENNRSFQDEGEGEWYTRGSRNSRRHQASLSSSSNKGKDKEKGLDSD